MKNKKWISLAAAVVLAVTALPMGVFAAKKDGEEEKLTKVTLNEVAHSIFYAPQYVAIEEGYFAEEGLDLTLVTGFGADKVLTALISGEADIGFMGAEASIYAYQEGATDPAVNFAQLTQRAGNFLVAREEMPDFKWEDLKGKKVLGGRKGGMPEMVFEYILRKNGLDPQKDLTIDQSRICYCFARSRFRLCSIHFLQCKDQLHAKKSRSHPEIHKCSPERHGICPDSHPGRNRESHCTTVCRN